MSVTDDDALALAVRALDEGGLVVLPTDTLYALAGDALDDDAVQRVFDAKSRAPDQGLPVCLGGLEDVQHVATLTPLGRALAEAHWPGALTLVLKAKPWVPDALTGGTGTVAVRAPSHPFALALARAFGPYTLTSANVSGKPPVADAEEARAQLGEHLALVVDAGRLEGTASTIVDATGDEARVLRQGAIPAAEIQRGRGRDRVVQEGR